MAARDNTSCGDFSVFAGLQPVRAQQINEHATKDCLRDVLLHKNVSCLGLLFLARENVQHKARQCKRTQGDVRNCNEFCGGVAGANIIYTSKKAHLQDGVLGRLQDV